MWWGTVMPLLENFWQVWQTTRLDVKSQKSANTWMHHDRIQTWVTKQKTMQPWHMFIFWYRFVVINISEHTWTFASFYGWLKTIVCLSEGEPRLLCTCSSATSSYMPASLCSCEQTLPWKCDISLCTVDVLTACVTAAMLHPHRWRKKKKKKTACNRMWAIECKKWTIAMLDRENEREEWRWMERQWITTEGQTRFTKGCHGSRIILGLLPWEKP